MLSAHQEQAGLHFSVLPQSLDNSFNVSIDFLTTTATTVVSDLPHLDAKNMVAYQLLSPDSQKAGPLGGPPASIRGPH